MRPQLFADVDGVLNALTWEGALKLDFDDFRESMPHRSYVLTTSKKMGQRILDLDVDIQWLTTWGDLANTHISPLVGFPQDLPVLAEPPAGAWETSYGANGWWKFNVVCERVGDGTNHPPFIWADDDMPRPWSTEGEQLAEWIDSLPIPVLLVKPNSQNGLTNADIDEMQRFVADVSAAA